MAERYGVITNTISTLLATAIANGQVRTVGFTVDPDTTVVGIKTKHQWHRHHTFTVKTTAMNAKKWFQSRAVRLQLGMATGLLCYLLTWHNPVCYKSLYSTAQHHFQLMLSKKTTGNGTDS